MYRYMYPLRTFECSRFQATVEPLIAGPGMNSWDEETGAVNSLYPMAGLKTRELYYLNYSDYDNL